jgi:hypothetical protein
MHPSLQTALRPRQGLSRRLNVAYAHLVGTECRSIVVPTDKKAANLDLQPTPEPLG